jgi:hypothetical protein
MNDNIPELKIELMDDSAGSLILLEQDSCGNIDRVAIHPIHLRYMAEKFGLVETSDPQAQKTITMLSRRMMALRDRIVYLSEWMAKHSDHKHADLSFEMTQINALEDVATEWCMDFDDQTPPMALHDGAMVTPENAQPTQAPLL